MIYYFIVYFLIKTNHEIMKERLRVNTENLKILLLEDDPDIRRLIKTVIESKFHCKVLEAENGKRGLSILDTENPFLIITDLMMPQMNGKEFIRILRKNENFQNTPIIVLSAIDEKEVIVELIQHGIVDYLLKPISPFILINKISDYVNKHYIDYSENEF
jgi:CheY-like chemotaxis protein